MVVATEVDEVVELRLTSLRPVVDVMGVNACAVAAREAAASVPCGECTAQRRRDRAGLAADVESATIAVHERDGCDVAGKPPPVRLGK
jgi:hypothetical protein